MIFRLLLIFTCSYCVAQTSNSIYKPNITFQENLKNELISASPEERIRILNSLAESYAYVDPHSVTNYAHQALQEAKELNLKTEIAIAHRNLGMGYHLTNDFYRSLNHFYEALALRDFVEKNVIANIQLGIGTVFLSTEHHDDAKSHLEEALSIFRSSNQYFDLARVHMNLATLAHNEGRFDESFSNLEKAKNMFERTDSDTLTAYYHLLMGRNFLQLNQFDQALEHLLKADARFGNGGFLSSKARALNDIAIVYQKTDRIEESIRSAKQALALAQATGITKHEASAHQSLALGMKKQGDIGKAYKHLSEFVRIRESVNENDTINRISTVAHGKEIEKLQMQEEALLEKNMLQMKLIALSFIVIAATLILTLILFIFIRTLLKSRKKEKAYIAELKQQQEEIESHNKNLSTLVSNRDHIFSIIAHDLRSPVGSLHSLINDLPTSEISSQEAFELLHQMKPDIRATFELIDRLLVWAKSQQNQLVATPEVVHLKSELESILPLFKERLEEKDISFEKNLTNNCHTFCDREMLSTILRNLISNAIKFTPINGILTINYNQIPDNLLIVRNTGAGISPETLQMLMSDNPNLSTFGTAGEKGSGLGLQICRSFAQINDIELTIKSEIGKFTEVALKLPKVK